MAEEDLIFGKNRHLFGGIEPSNMISFSIVSKANSIKLLAVLPKDTTIDGQVLCTVGGAVIRRRSDKCPEDEFDGDLVADITESGTVTDATADLSQTYYYAAFPYSVQGVYNRSRSTRVKYSPTTAYYVYGFDLDTTNPDPDTRVTYPSDVDNELFEPAKMNFTGTTAEGTFSYGSWPSTPGEGFMPRPCIYDKQSNVVYKYLMPDDYLTYIDGSSVDLYWYSSKATGYNNTQIHDAMMEWPKIYTKRELIDGVYKFRCSSEKIDSSWECWCNYDRSNNEIDHFYTSIYKRTLNLTSLSTFYNVQYYSSYMNAAARTLDVVKGNTAETDMSGVYYGHVGSSIGNNSDYNIEVLSDHLLIQDLLIMMAKTTDLKSAYGDGWTETADTTASEIGALNKKGLFYGAPKYSGTSTQTGRVKIFGMEDYWDSQYSRRLAGWINDKGTIKIKLTVGTKDGTTVTGYNTTGEGYLTVSNTYAGSGGYISECDVGSYGRIPIVYSGSETTYECDYVSNGNQAVYFAIIGGFLNGSKNYGPFGVVLNKEANYISNSVGASVSCKPSKTS